MGMMGVVLYVIISYTLLLLLLLLLLLYLMICIPIYFLSLFFFLPSLQRCCVFIVENECVEIKERCEDIRMEGDVSEIFL
jgi:hypothetical protein